MPRGNDSEAAGTELKAKVGIAANAEARIAANKERWSRELSAALKRPVDRAATAEVDEGEAQGYVEGDETAITWAVRGPFIVVVSEDEFGTLHKHAHTFKGREKQAERLLRTPNARSAATGTQRGEATTEDAVKAEAKAAETHAQTQQRGGGRGRQQTAQSGSGSGSTE